MMVLQYVDVKRFTSYVREFGSAALFAMMVISTIFFARYVVTAWIEQGPRRVWRRFYNYENKAAIALLTTFIGAAVKNGAALIALHWQNADEHPHTLVLAGFYTAGTLVALWGMICLMRALSRYDWARGTWLVLAFVALAFGAAFVAS